MELKFEESATSEGKNCINSNQIKSATDNNGEFSNENDSILYSLADDKQWQTMDANTQRRIDADYEFSRNQYFGTDKWMKAPNGQPTKLTERQWVMVHTPAFKAWFGDWEKRSRINKLQTSESLIIDTSNDRLDASSSVSEITKYLKDNYQGKTFTNKDTGKSYLVARRGINKMTSHSMSSDAYIASLQHISELVEGAIYITSETARKDKSRYNEYDYYVTGLKIGGEDYVAKIVMGLDSNGEWYYDQSLTQIEKGTLIGYLKQTVTQNSLQIKDTTLLDILQSDSSVVLDENGEPLVVYHGTNWKGTPENSTFDVDRVGDNFEINVK